MAKPEASTERRLAALRGLIPEAFEDGRLVPDRLLAALGLPPGAERYGLGFAGKAAAIDQVRRPATGTLRPCPELSADWDTTANLLLEGDNLEVLRLLQRQLAGRVGLIYIDPPYNTGQEFVYSDDFRDPLPSRRARRGQSALGGEHAETAGRLHSRWLAMMYPRLHLARSLLRPDGVILVSIDGNEHRNLLLLMCEVFGEENRLGDFVWKKKSGGGSDAGAMVVDHEYVVCFGRTPSATLGDDPLAEVTTAYNRTDEKGDYSLERLDKQNLGYDPGLDFPIEGPDGRVYRVAHKDPAHPQARWRWSRKSVEERRDELVFKGGCVYTKNRRKPGARPRSLLVDQRFGRTRSGRADLVALLGAEVLDHPKPVRLIRHFLRIASRPDDVVLDFFAGSGTTAQAVYEANAEDGGTRRVVLVQLPEPCRAGSLAKKQGFATVADIARERVRRAALALPPPRPGEDRGFRVFRLDSSCWRAPGSEGGDLGAAPLSHVDRETPGRSDADRLWEQILASGRSLTARADLLPEPYPAGSWSIDGGALICCLAPALDQKDVQALLARGPEEIVVLDCAMGGDESLLLACSADAAARGARLRTV